MTQSTEATQADTTTQSQQQGGAPDGAQPGAAADTQPGAKPDASAAPQGDVLDSSGEATSQSPAAGDVLSGDDDAKQEGVPDQYTFEAPEGVELNQEAVDAAMAAAKEAGLTQAQFEALAKFDIERTQAANEQAVDEWNNRVNGWREAARNDKEFGGQNYEANVKSALRLVERFGDAEFKALVKSPSEDNPEGLAIGNHPALLRFLNRIGKVLSDPEPVEGDAVQQGSTDEARLRRMYPSMFEKSA